MPIINQMLVMLYELMAIAFQPQSLFLALMLQDAPDGFSCLAWNRLGGGDRYGNVLVWAKTLEGKGFG